MQVAGAFAASAVLYGAFRGSLRLYEAANRITRGAPGSEASAMVFGEYFPNPAWHAPALGGIAAVTPASAFLVEATGAFLLCLVVLCVTDARNRSHPAPLTAATIGLTITILISLFGPLTMAGFNPARDFAPRLFSALAGWGTLVFRANGPGWLLVYIIGPLLGGQAGALAYRFVFLPLYAQAPAGADGRT
jgi:glycerol uptake facilitator-like aquaporin